MRKMVFVLLGFRSLAGKGGGRGKWARNRSVFFFVLGQGGTGKLKGATI